jgi:hypothetical protein
MVKKTTYVASDDTTTPTRTESKKVVPVVDGSKRAFIALGERRNVSDLKAHVVIA